MHTRLVRVVGAAQQVDQAVFTRADIAKGQRGLAGRGSRLVFWRCHVVTGTAELSLDSAGHFGAGELLDAGEKVGHGWPFG